MTRSLRMLLAGAPLVLLGACSPSAMEKDRQFDDGSGLVLQDISPRQVETLFVAGKVWGFLKYHHPAITAGEHHWDYELLRRLPALLAAGDAVTAQKVLLDWVDGLGEIDDCERCARLDAAGLQISPRLDWLRDHELLGPALSSRLEAIYRNRIPGRQFFVGAVPNIGNPDFGAEVSYPQLALPDSGFQVLAIYRYWNIVEYWFPYRDLIDEPWDEVLRDTLRSAAVGLDSPGFQRELMALVARTDDGHANLASALREPAGRCQLPVHLRFVEGRFVVESRAEDSVQARQFEPGDVLLSLDDVAVEDIVVRVRRFYGASNENARMTNIARNLTRGTCGPVKVGVQRDGTHAIDALRVDAATLPLGLLYSNERPGETLQLLAPDTAYLKLSSIRLNEVDDHIRKLQGVKNLLVDIRAYPEYVVYDLAPLLLDSIVPFVLLSRPDLSNPGAFRFGPEVTLTPKEPRFSGRVAILVDEISISRAEYVAMALRASPRALVAGSQTAGADGNLSEVPLPGGFKAGISGLGVFYPDKRPTQQVGVAIDVPCPSTIAGLRAGRDETLECALRALEGAR